MTVPERLKSTAINLCGSQKNFSLQTGISYSLLNKYINGSSEPGAESLSRLSAFGLSVDWLLTGQGSMFMNNEAGRSLESKHFKSLMQKSTGEAADNKNFIESNVASVTSSLSTRVPELSTMTIGELRSYRKRLMTDLDKIDRILEIIDSQDED